MMPNGTQIASLPMYDWPEVRSATDAIWNALAGAFASAGIEKVPTQLDRQTAMADQWAQPGLLFSQTCGFPLTHEFKDRLQIIATPCYDVPGCSGSNYSSVVIVNAESNFEHPRDLAGGHVAYNSGDSMSGLLALKAVFAPLAGHESYFTKVSCSGGHGNSMQMVADGEADVAAIDCVGFALANRHKPEMTRRLRVIAESPQAPALPYVTAPGRPSQEVERMQNALVSVLEDPNLQEARSDLFLTGCEITSQTAYDRILEIEAVVNQHGYSELR